MVHANLLSLVSIISNLFTLLNERVELNYCWACANLVYHLKILAGGRLLLKYLFHPEIFKKYHEEILPPISKKLVRALRDGIRLVDNSLVLNGVQILNNLSKVSQSNPPKSEEIFKQLIL